MAAAMKISGNEKSKCLKAGRNGVAIVNGSGGINERISALAANGEK
jgi:hypothetical protein